MVTLPNSTLRLLVGVNGEARRVTGSANVAATVLVFLPIVRPRLGLLCGVDGTVRPKSYGLGW